MQLFATLRPVLGDRFTPSDWRAVAEAALIARSDVSRLGPSEFAIDAGDGRNLKVRFDEKAMTFHGRVEDSAWYDEEHGTWEEDDDANAPLDDLMWEIGRVLCIKLRWGLFTERGVIDHLPSECPGCRAPLFDHEDACKLCGHVS